MVHTISVERLTKRYGSIAAVDDISFAIEPGRVTGFLGPNGAGKTTTMSCLLGLAAPTSGIARIMGDRFCQLDHPARTVGAVLGVDGLHPGRSGRGHLRVLAAAAGLDPGRVDVVLDRVGLSEAADRRVRGWSLGMRQRLGLAAALLGDPSILVLDEPANGLDPAGMRDLRRLLRRFADDGGTVLLSSHVLSEVAQVADDLIVVGHGKLLAHAPLAQLADGSTTLEDTYMRLTTAAEGVR